MKKALIIFAVLFALTLAVPAIAAFTEPPAQKTDELVTLFTADINCPLSFHLSF